MNRTLCILSLLAGVHCGLLKADRLDYTVTSTVGAGQVSYQFTLTNSGATGGPVFDLFLALPTDLTNINTSAISKPPGWGDPAGGLLFFGPNVSPSTSFVEWNADFSGDHDLAIGSARSGFSFTSLGRINGPITFALNNSTTFAAAVPPADAPEPATLAMLLAGFAGLAIWHRVRSARARARQP
ncbi:MAG: PEP-CTERM sorting domain-containing protein [Bryobacteraceae bacterium]